MVCACRGRHMYECGCASGQICAGRTAECVCVFELLSGALLMRFFHILDVPVNQKTLRWPVYFFSPTLQAHIHKFFSLALQKHINIHTHAHTFANTHAHLAFWLACTQPSGQLDRQITHTHTHTLNAVFLSTGCQSV